MPQKALLYDPDLVRITPMPPARHIRGRENFDLGSELMVGHKVGLSTDVEIPSDGPRRRDTKEVQGALDRISIQEKPDALSNLYENVRRHRSISEYEREILDEAVEVRMREIAPARATRLFGPRDSMARRVLQSIYDDLANTLDFSSNRVGNGVKAGGTMISGERHVDLYLSYKNEDGLNVGLTWLQDASGTDPYLLVSVRQVGGSNPGTLAERRFETGQKNDAAASYRAELAKVIR